MKAGTVVTVLVLAMGLCAQSLAETKTWTGGESDRWDVDDNWDPTGRPQSGDDVIHGTVDPGNDPGAPIIFDVDDPDYEINSFTATAGDGRGLTIDEGLVLTVTEKMIGDTTAGEVYVLTLDSRAEVVVAEGQPVGQRSMSGIDVDLLAGTANDLTTIQVTRLWPPGLGEEPLTWTIRDNAKAQITLVAPFSHGTPPVQEPAFATFTVLDGGTLEFGEIHGNKIQLDVSGADGVIDLVGWPSNAGHADISSATIESGSLFRGIFDDPQGQRYTSSFLHKDGQMTIANGTFDVEEFRSFERSEIVFQTAPLASFVSTLRMQVFDTFGNPRPGIGSVLYGDPGGLGRNLLRAESGTEFQFQDAVLMSSEGEGAVIDV